MKRLVERGGGNFQMKIIVEWGDVYKRQFLKKFVNIDVTQSIQSNNRIMKKPQTTIKLLLPIFEMLRNTITLSVGINNFFIKGVLQYDGTNLKISAFQRKINIRLSVCLQTYL